METQTAPETNKTMKAVRFHGKEDLRFEDIPEPTCGPGQVKVKPAWWWVHECERALKSFG
jgi:hypothetical protein